MTSFLLSRFDRMRHQDLHRRLVSALGFLLLNVSVEGSLSGTGYRTGEHTPFQWVCLRTSLRDGAAFYRHP